MRHGPPSGLEPRMLWSLTAPHLLFLIFGPSVGVEACDSERMLLSTVESAEAGTAASRSV